MFDRYWTVWAAAVCMFIASGQGLADTECYVHEFQSPFGEYQGKKVNVGIRQRCTVTSLLKCLSCCNRVAISNVFFNQGTQDCICPLAHPRSWLLVNAPGYVYYNSPELVDMQIQEVLGVSSTRDGFPETNAIGGSAAAWKPRLDDADPWIEFGVRRSLYLVELRIHKDMSSVTTSVWLRDGSGLWIKTWTRGDGGSAQSDWFFPHFRMLTVRTDAVRLNFDNPSAVEIRFIRVVGREN
ncbi:uncharacterized protein LOC124273235 [Haliotis rubra]|uniref:uncharacterized protein LOC124273235 n=1 Tax=Haliotis rubra TaxID=36100 RepID=UPI001EE4FC51|nr:uncharacterized protein LOC124273235 [Haliotis rubra]